MLDLNSNIQYIKGVGEKKAGLFNKLAFSAYMTLLNIIRAHTKTAQ